MSEIPDIDQQETQEWLDALDAVLEREGAERAHFLLEKLTEKARRSGAHLPFSANTAYLNTIPVHQEDRCPGDLAMERRIRAFIRWNAIATVMRANKQSPGVGGHIASYQSAATLYEVGFNHFFRAPTEDHGGDLLYIQGHLPPAFMPAPSSKAGSPKSSCTTSARKWTARACLPTRIPG